MPPTYRVVLTRQALVDLQEIFDYIKQNSPDTAPEVIRRILDSIDALNEMPGRHPMVGRTRSGKLEVHRLVVRPYLVYYTSEKRLLKVTVLSVLHGARRQPKRFD